MRGLIVNYILHSIFNLHIFSVLVNNYRFLDISIIPIPFIATAT